MNGLIRVLLITTLPIVGFGCSGVRESQFRPEGPMSSRLLPLQVHIVDLNAYRGEASLGGSALSQMTRQMTQDRADETRHLIKRDLQENVFGPADRPVGHISFKVTRTQGLQQWWAIPTAFSLFMVNLFGFPFNAYTTNVMLDVRIFDRDYQEVAHYAVAGKSTAHIAMYWGYSPDASTQASLVDATKIALKSLKSQLESATPELNKRLARHVGGEIPPIAARQPSGT